MHHLRLLSKHSLPTWQTSSEPHRVPSPLSSFLTLLESQCCCSGSSTDFCFILCNYMYIIFFWCGGSLRFCIEVGPSAHPGFMLTWPLWQKGHCWKHRLICSALSRTQWWVVLWPKHLLEKMSNGRRIWSQNGTSSVESDLVNMPKRCKFHAKSTLFFRLAPVKLQDCMQYSPLFR